MSKNIPCFNVKINKPKITIFNVVESKEKKTNINNLQSNEKAENNAKLEKIFLTTSSSDFKSINKSPKTQISNIAKSNIDKKFNTQSISENGSIESQKNSMGMKNNKIAQSLSNLRKVLEENFNKSSPNRNNNMNLLKNSSPSHKIYKLKCEYCNHFKSNYAKAVIKRNLFKSNMKYINENNSNAIDFIIYNVKCHLVCLFKEYLIYYDLGEFLKRSYTLVEAKPRIKRAAIFYKSSYIFFPIMSSLNANFYFNKNLHRRKKIVQIKLEEIEEIENVSKSQLTTFLKSAYLELLRKDDNIFKAKIDNNESEPDIVKIINNISSISKDKMISEVDNHSIDNFTEDCEFEISGNDDYNPVHEEKKYMHVGETPFVEFQFTSYQNYQDINNLPSQK